MADELTGAGAEIQAPLDWSAGGLRNGTLRGHVRALPDLNQLSARVRRNRSAAPDFDPLISGW
jgi:hypothetical protein